MKEGLRWLGAEGDRTHWEWVPPEKKCPPLRTCEGDLIWEESLKMELMKGLTVRASWIIQVGPAYNDRVLRRDTDRGGSPVKTEAQTGGLRPQAEEHPEPPGAGRGGKGPLQELSERAWPCPLLVCSLGKLTSDVWLSELCETQLLCYFKSPILPQFVMVATGKEHDTPGCWGESGGHSMWPLETPKTGRPARTWGCHVYSPLVYF